MSYRTKTKRKRPPNPVIYENRRNWGGRLLLELNSLGKSVAWLGEKVGYKNPMSMHQVINGHQGYSQEIYERIIKLVPEMRDVVAPRPTKPGVGTGAPGPHKNHDYPKLGSRESRRPAP